MISCGASTKLCPERGLSGIFNRSHYEDVLVPRVHGLVPWTWILQASLEPRLLLLLRDVQVKFENGYVILREVLLEGVYLMIARLDPVRRGQRVHAGHQHILIHNAVG